MTETSGKPETYYGPHTKQEDHDFFEKHTIRQNIPRPKGLLRKLLDRGTRTESSIEYDVAAIKEATRSPFPVPEQSKSPTFQGKATWENGVGWVPKKKK